MSDYSAIIALLDKHAPKEMALARIGLTPDQVRAAAAKYR